MECPAKKLKNDAFDLLPNEIVIKIFGYLSQNQLGQIARVCQRWNVLTRSPVLWKKVNVKLYHRRKSQNFITKHFISLLPPCVSYLRLDFRVSSDWLEALSFAEISWRLRKHCPQLKVLILECARLLDSLTVVTNLCAECLGNLKVLVFSFTFFPYCPRIRESKNISKLEILDVSRCDFEVFNKPLFSRLTHLKQFYLRNTNVHDAWFEEEDSFTCMNQIQILDLGETEIAFETFQAIQIYGLNLSELYLCGTDVQLRDAEDDDLNLNDNMFPHLKTICFRFCDYVSCEGVVSLIKSNQSVENVYVDEDVAESYIMHPFVVENKCKLDIVKYIDWCNHEKDYFCNVLKPGIS